MRWRVAGGTVVSMGWSYRKSVRIGPFRVNASRSGVGYSVGVPGVRTGVSSRGRRYTTFSVPGTGLSYRTGSPSGVRAGCLSMIVMVIGTFGVIIGRCVW